MKVVSEEIPDERRVVEGGSPWHILGAPQGVGPDPSVQLCGRENVHKKPAIPGAGTPSSVEADVGMEEMGFQVHEQESWKRCLLQQAGELDRQYLAQYAGRRIEQRARFGRKTVGEVASMEQVLCIGRIYEVLIFF